MTSGAQPAGAALVFNGGSATVKVASIVRDDLGQLTRAADLLLDGHGAAEQVLDRMRTTAPFHDTMPPDVIGHRVVHGGPVQVAKLIDSEVERIIEQYGDLAPLHNAASLAMIRAAAVAYPGVPQVAVFDTAFHATMPTAASRYALPTELADRFALRRYGFHGISCDGATQAVAAYLGKDVDDLSVIICHLGGGASVTAVRQGRSVDTSMGLTPLAGLVMGTRSGDLDPAVVPYLMRVAAMTGEDVLDLLMHRSGLVGLCGDEDLRVIRRRAGAGDESACTALAVYTHRIRHFVGAYVGQLPDLDALVFTGGVGEHDVDVREEVVGPLAHLGLELDPGLNAAGAAGVVTRIGGGADSTPVLVVRADEETAIAKAAFSLVES
ncbi:MAG: acetate/propionate family kinase [Nocardioidaceae bacterium]